MNNMDTIRKLFPYSFKSETGKDLLVTIIFYIIINVVVGFVLGLLDGIPLVGFVFAVLGWLLGIYILVGIIIAVLNFMGVLKK